MPSHYGRNGSRRGSMRRGNGRRSTNGGTHGHTMDDFSMAGNPPHKHRAPNVLGAQNPHTGNQPHGHRITNTVGHFHHIDANQDPSAGHPHGMGHQHRTFSIVDSNPNDGVLDQFDHHHDITGGAHTHSRMKRSLPPQVRSGGRNGGRRQTRRGTMGVRRGGRRRY